MSNDKEIIPNELIQKVIDTYLEGKFKNADEIAIYLGMPVDVVKGILERFVNNSSYDSNAKKAHFVSNEEEQVVVVPSSQNDRIADLQKLLDMMKEMVDIAEWEYSQIPNEKSASTLSSFVNTTSSLIAQLEKYDDKKKLAEKMIKDVLDPFSSSVFKMFIEELKHHILSSLPIYLSKEQQVEIDAKIKMCFKSIGNNFEDKLVHTRSKISDLMGVALIENSKKGNKPNE